MFSLSMYVYIQISPFHKETSHHGSGGHLSPGWPNLNWWCLQWPSFQIRSQSGSQDFNDMNQPTAPPHLISPASPGEICCSLHFTETETEAQWDLLMQSRTTSCKVAKLRFEMWSFWLQIAVSPHYRSKIPLPTVSAWSFLGLVNTCQLRGPEPLHYYLMI